MAPSLRSALLLRGARGRFSAHPCAVDAGSRSGQRLFAFLVYGTGRRRVV